MFDIGAPELFIVAVLAIIVVGPKDLPKLIRSVMGMIKKVREMGSEFQAGVKKMADEVELDSITRKLNEAGNITLDDVKTDVKPSTEISDYDEFDYDEYDYDNGSYNAPDIKKDDEDTEATKTDAPKTDAPKTDATTTEVEETTSTAEEEKTEVTEDPEVEAPVEEVKEKKVAKVKKAVKEKVKSKADD